MSEPPCQKIPAVIYATGTSTERIERTDRTVAEPQTTGSPVHRLLTGRPPPFRAATYRSRDPFGRPLSSFSYFHRFVDVYENKEKIRGETASKAEEKRRSLANRVMIVSTVSFV